MPFVNFASVDIPSSGLSSTSELFSVPSPRPFCPAPSAPPSLPSGLVPPNFFDMPGLTWPGDGRIGDRMLVSLVAILENNCSPSVHNLVHRFATYPAFFSPSPVVRVTLASCPLASSSLWKETLLSAAFLEPSPPRSVGLESSAGAASASLAPSTRRGKAELW